MNYLSSHNKRITIITKIMNEIIDTDQVSTPATEEVFCEPSTSEDDDSDHELESSIQDIEPTPQEIAQRAVTLYSGSVDLEWREEDISEEEKIEQFVTEGCQCNLGPKKTPCCKKITVDHYKSVHSQMKELTHEELDLVVLAQLMATLFRASTTRSEERSRTYTFFFHGGERICQDTFRFLHTIGHFKFKALKTHFAARGLEPRTHGNKGKHQPSGLSLEEIQGVVQFILNYAGM